MNTLYLKRELFFNILHQIFALICIFATGMVASKNNPELINLIVVLVVMSFGYTIKKSNDENGVREIVKNIKNETDILKQDGWYSFTRNPCYLGQIIIVFGFLFLAPHLFNFLCFVSFVLFVNVTVSVEEKRLKEKFGDSYVKYCSITGRWFPKKFF